VSPRRTRARAAAPFDLGAESSALTHGHPTGILAGGAFAFLIGRLMEGASLLHAVTETRAFVATKSNSDETTCAMDAASKLAESRGEPTPEKVESGDSDSTGSMAGQLLALIGGLEAIPERWRTRVELCDMLDTIAEDLAAVRFGEFDTSQNRDRYPGW